MITPNGQDFDSRGITSRELVFFKLHLNGYLAVALKTKTPWFGTAFTKA